MAEHLFDEMKRYVGFGPDDEGRLRETGAQLSERFGDVVDAFYAQLVLHPEALEVVERFSTIERLEATLRAWLERFFTGPWDRAYYEQRARIGRRHVEIGLAQHYMVTAMYTIRERLTELVLGGAGDAEVLRARAASVSKLVDLELGIMLETYQEDCMRDRARHERLATFGLLTSTLAHELRNPLAVIDTSLYLLREHVPDTGEGHRHLDKIQVQVRRCSRLIASFLDLVRDRPLRSRRVRPAEIAERAAQAILEERGARVAPSAGPDLPELEADADQLQQVLANLLSNAADAAGPTGDIRLDVELGDDQVRFVVSDDGPGIDPSVEARLFEPLVTTKDHGVGIGLAICRKIAAAHGGEVERGASRLRGATFVLALPVAGR